MADIGIRVSQPGFDVDAADYNMLFSSSWPLLKIAHQGSFTVTDSRVAEVVVTHTLGYVPMFLIFRKSGIISQFDSYGQVTSSINDIGDIGASTTQLKYFPGAGNLGSTITFYYFVFRLNLTEKFTAPQLETGDTQTAIDHDFGIKITKMGKNISSTDLRDFSVHSGTRSPLIHIVDNGVPNETAQEVGAPALQYRKDHGLGYLPLAYSYVNYGANGEVFDGLDRNFYYMLGEARGPDTVRFYITSAHVRVEDDFDLLGFSSTTTTAAFVVLKDPFAGNKPLTEVTF